MMMASKRGRWLTLAALSLLSGLSMYLFVRSEDKFNFLQGSEHFSIFLIGMVPGWIAYLGFFMNHRLSKMWQKAIAVWSLSLALSPYVT